MAKEIYEQPEVIGHTFGHYLDLEKEVVCLPELPFDLAAIEHISITACGTALYAGAVANIGSSGLAAFRCRRISLPNSATATRP